MALGGSSSLRSRYRWTVVGACLAFASFAGSVLADGFLSESRYVRDDSIFETYVNGRFGYVIDYPVGVFLPQPPVENGDGRTFVSVDGTASLAVWGSHLAFIPGDLGDGRVDVATWYAAELDQAVDVRYTVLREELGWFVISGVDGDDVYYRRSIAAPERCGYLTFELRYPEADATVFDPIVARAFATFRCDVAAEGGAD